MASSRSARSLFPKIVKHSELISSKNLTQLIGEAFNDDGLGVIAVAEIPGYSQARFSLLKQAREIYGLPQSAKSSLICPKAFYKVGYSHGHEIYKGQTNSTQSNFHANFIDNPEVPNVWPSQLPHLKSAFLDLSSIFQSTSAYFLSHIDHYIEELFPKRPSTSFQQNFLQGTRTVGTFMYYLPQNIHKEWSRWHCDHELMQGISCPLFIDENSNRIIDMEEMGYDTKLHIKTRQGEIVSVKCESDYLILLIGESIQIMSGGAIKATPHSVINDGKLGNVSRSTFVMFMPPKFDLVLDCPDEEKAFADLSGLTSLKEKWKKGMTFQEFDRATFA